MKYLLDTHVFLWTVFTPDKLSGKARRAIEDPDNLISQNVVLITKDKKLSSYKRLGLKTLWR